MFFSVVVEAHPGPWDGNAFHGRIAYSADGNYNDRDDWAASPVALAILASSGVGDRVVHFHYNSILSKTDPVWERAHAASVLGAARQFGFPESICFDCCRQRDNAVASLQRAVDASSAGDPLYLIIAGPVDVPYLAIWQSDPQKRRFVYCISHNRWNDGYASAELVRHTKRDLIALDVHWCQITDQNRFLSTSRYGRPTPASAWQPWYWMRDAHDPAVQFLWQRMQASGRPDCSDAGMAWFLVTGDQNATPDQLKSLIVSKQLPAVCDPRQSIRVEAENFRFFEHCAVEYRNDRHASQRINVRQSGPGSGEIRTALDEPYMAARERYDVAIRWLAPRTIHARLTLRVNGNPAGQPEQPAAGTGDWSTHTVQDVAIAAGDELAIQVRCDGGASVKLD